MGSAKLKIWPKNFGNDHKNREKNLQFFDVKQSKIRWTVVEKKFIKSKNFFKNWEAQNEKVGVIKN